LSTAWIPSTGPAEGTAHRVWAYAVGLVTVAAMLWPLAGLQQGDSFPLSTYPMFTAKRDRVTIYLVEGVRRDAAGRERSEPVSPRFVAEHDVVQATASVRRAARGGVVSRRRLCRRVAQSLIGDAAYADVQAVEIVRASYDPVAYFVVDAEPLARHTLQRCEVER